MFSNLLKFCSVILSLHFQIVTNDTQRDAFRRHFSADERKELASVEADIKAIEVSQFKVREDLDAKKEALSCIRAKAQLQAAALTYLA